MLDGNKISKRKNSVEGRIGISKGPLISVEFACFWLLSTISPVNIKLSKHFYNNRLKHLNYKELLMSTYQTGQHSTLQVYNHLSKWQLFFVSFLLMTWKEFLKDYCEQQIAC